MTDHLDSNIPGNPAYHFTILPPESTTKAGWGQRPALVPSARAATRCVHAGVQPDPAFGAVMPPLYLSSTFAFKDICTNAGYDYTRSGNPTRASLEEALTILEGGSGATCTSTGMSAVIVALNLLPVGSHLICTVDCYGGTFRALEHAKRTYGLEVTYLDLADLDAVEAALRPNTKLIWVETPSNPLLRLTDISAIAKIAQRIGALTAVDNTFLSPALQRPFEHGADLVIHSTTKYLNGHSDVVGGAVIARKDAPALAQQIQSLNNLLGTSQSPHDCFLVLRGLKTLQVRLKQHQIAAAEVAAFLQTRPEVRVVHYPGLASHPQRALAERQQDGPGAMLSFELKDGSQTRVDHILRSLRWFTLAESLGGVESLVAHPASMTHASMTPEARAKAGISDGLIRLSIGIEDPADLIEDLRQAFETLPICAAHAPSARITPLTPTPV